jgi:hypothetical protein
MGEPVDDSMSDQDLEILENLLQDPFMEMIQGINSTEVMKMLAAVQRERARRQTNDCVAGFARRGETGAFGARARRPLPPLTTAHAR